MCDMAVNVFYSTKKIVTECIMTQEVCEQAVDRYYFVFDFIPD